MIVFHWKTTGEGELLCVCVCECKGAVVKYNVCRLEGFEVGHKHSVHCARISKDDQICFIQVSG